MNDNLSIMRIDYRQRIFQAMNYINQNIEQELSLAEISAIACFSSFHFHRIFKAVVGENVAEFTRRLRMELAVNRLLAWPSKDITSIAISCGFSSSQNFAKAFQKQYKTTPTKYRRNKANQNETSVEFSENFLQALYVQKQQTLTAVALRQMPLSLAATIRCIGMDEETCAKSFTELLAWANGRVIPGPGKLIGLYWDNPDVTPPDKCRFDCCLLIPAGIAPSEPIFFQQIGGGLWAFCRFETKPDGFRNSWEESFRWLAESGYESRSLPCYEIYYNNAQEHPEGKWIYDIAIPLKER